MEKFPSYEELIRLLNDAKNVTEGVLSAAELIAEDLGYVIHRYM